MMNKLFALFALCLASCSATADLRSSQGDCSTFTDCTSCTSAQTWMPGANCRFCIKDSKCHAEGSLENPCNGKDNAYKPSDCPSHPPAPTPSPPAITSSNFAQKIFTALLKVLKITDVDVATCVKDVGNADMYLHHFASDVTSKNRNLTNGVEDLSKAMSSFSTAVNDCGVSEIQNQIDALAIAIKWANISTTKFDKDIAIVIGASNLWQDIEALANAIKSEDTTSAGEALSKLLDDWSSVTGGCKDSKTCKLVDGILRTLGVVAEHIAPCEAALNGPIGNLTSGAAAFKAHNYRLAVGEISTGLDGIAKAIGTDACGLKDVADHIAKLSPKLASAVVKIESSKAVAIMVGTANIYDTLFESVVDLDRKDYAGFGIQMGKLLGDLQASSCSTKVCVVLEGILASLQLEATDFEKCTSDLDGSWDALSDAYSDIENKQYIPGLQKLGFFFQDLAHGVSDCGVPELGQILEKTATQLGSSAIANDIGDVVQVLVNGADVTLDISKLYADFRANRWSGVGQDMGDLASWLNAVKCNSFVCHLVEGFLNSTGIVFSHLEACEADLKQAETYFTAGASYWGKDEKANAIKYWASGLNVVAKSVTDCGASAELEYLQQEANVLGFGNVTAFGKIDKILVHGADFYEELYSTFVDFSKHDYRSAGADLGKVLDQLTKWTKGHSCQSDFCYVVVGILQFMGDIQGSVGECKADFKLAFGNFSAGFHALANNSHDPVFNYHHDEAAVKEGINDIGAGMKLVAKGVSDCHLQEFADLLEKLAVKLGLVPEISWLEDLLEIVIDGVQIENEVGDACQDYSDGNWVGFGFNVAKLVKTLVEK